MITFFLSALATFCYVTMRAFQQLNVVHEQYVLIPVTSIVMGVMDVAVVLLIVKADTLWLGVGNGVAGALGCYTAIWVHKWWRKRDGVDVRPDVYTSTLPPR